MYPIRPPEADGERGAEHRAPGTALPGDRARPRRTVAPPPPVQLACAAMATRFELVLHGGEPPRLRAAGEEAVRVITRLDAQLSCHRPNSDVSHINALAAEAPVTVEPLLFDLLCRARALHRQSAGAFDITVGPAMRCWGLHERSGGSVPRERSLAQARLRVGMDQVELDERNRTVRFARPGMAIDLGSIGKGYALAQAALALRELGVSSALLHGGTSSITTIGAPPAAPAWQIAIEYPDAGAAAGSSEALDLAAEERLLALVPLRDASLSVSAVWGKSFAADDACYGHVIDPRTARPVEGALLAAVVCDDATAADALSTALLVLGPEAHHPVSESNPTLAALVLGRGSGSGYRIWSRGIAVRPRRDAAPDVHVA